MRARGLAGIGMLVFVAAMVAGCGSNATQAGVTVTPTTATVALGGNQPFGATVTGVSATTAFWQICLPSNNSNTTVKPPNCSVPVGPPGCTLPAVPNPLTGFGTMTSTGIYSAPLQLPQTNTIDVVASSCVDDTAFAIATVTLESGVTIQVDPSAATLGTGQSFAFTAFVTGPVGVSAAVNWTLSSTAAAGTNLGSVTATGVYTAPPASPGAAVMVTATSVVDPSKLAAATVTIGAAADPTFTSVAPTNIAEGSVQQDVYVNGTGLFNGSTIIVGGVQEPLSAITFLSGTLLRVTIPGRQLTTPGPLSIQLNNGIGLSAPVNLMVNPVRPTLISSSRDSIVQNSAGAGITLTGGFYVNTKTLATFNGLGCGQAVCTSFVDSRHLSLTIPAGNLTVPGLYPIEVQSSDAAAAGVPSLAALNLAVTPPSCIGAAGGAACGIPTAPTAGPAVGSAPSGIAIDYADAKAVVANMGDGTISIINLAANTVQTITLPPLAPPFAPCPTPFAHTQPTGVAVDDLLTVPVALVVNSADETVTAINLANPIPANITTTCIAVSGGPNPPLPLSVGINPITPQPTGVVGGLTHRAVIAYQSTNVATVFDVSVVGGTPVLSSFQQVGAGVTNYSTGQNPAIAIDPRLNWAVITPGGAGTINVVDLGHDANPPGGDSGRSPQVVATVNIDIGVQGVSIDTETHQAFLTDPDSGIGSDTNPSLSLFSVLDETVSPLQFQNNGTPISKSGFISSAANPLTNVGIAIQNVVSANNAVVADLESGNVLQNVSLGAAGQAVAVDPIGNEAVILNQGSPGSVSFLPLGAAPNPLQILEASPTIAYTSAAGLPLNITGGGFVAPTQTTAGSEVTLDGAPITTKFISTRQLQATVPPTMLGSARHYTLQVQNPGPPAAFSNVTDLTIVQPIAVGAAPAGVAVDTYRDLAVVANAGDNTASLVALTPTTPIGPSQTAAGTVGVVATLPVGTTPVGVATLPRLGLAVVTNNNSDNVSLLDETQTPPLPSQTSPGCSTAGACIGQLGVAIDQDTGTAVIADGVTNNVSIAAITAAASPQPPMITGNTFTNVDQFPTAVAIDPLVNPFTPGVGEAAVGTISQASSVQIVGVPSGLVSSARITGLDSPTSIIFDPVNQFFVAVDSLQNNVVFIDPQTFIETPASVGVNPTSLDYNFQASTLVTVNSFSHSMSILDYVCPPAENGQLPQCSAPQVRAVLGLGGSQTSLIAPTEPNAVAVDPQLNEAVVVDPDNNRILVVPLLH